MTESVEALFEQGIEQYKAGADAKALIPLFKEVCDRAPKSSAALTCLAWLYLLDDQGDAAYKVAQRAVKLNGQDPQSRVNLAIACLEVGKKGVRDHIDVASQVMMVSAELRQEIEDNLEEGLRRRPDFKSLLKVRQWLLGSG
jgi:predicted Zn-dependent protease